MLFLFCCHQSVNTFTGCHDTHFFRCRCRHNLVQNPFYDDTEWSKYILWFLWTGHGCVLWERFLVFTSLNLNFLATCKRRVQTLPLLKEKDFEGKSENFSSIFPPTQCVQAIQTRFLSPSQWLSCHCKSVFPCAFLLAWIGPDDGSGTISFELVSMFSGDKDVGWKHGHLEAFKYPQDTMYMMGFPYVRFTCPWASGRWGGGGEERTGWEHSHFSSESTK